MTDGLHDDLRIAIMRLARRMRLERVEGDITDGKLSVLFHLAKDGPQTIGALSEAERISPPSMTRTITALVDVGLVTRNAAPDDGRKVLIDLSDAGREIVTETKRRRVAWFARQMELLDDHELAALDAAAPIIRKLADS